MNREKKFLETLKRKPKTKREKNVEKCACIYKIYALYPTMAARLLYLVSALIFLFCILSSFLFFVLLYITIFFVRSFERRPREYVHSKHRLYIIFDRYLQHSHTHAALLFCSHIQQEKLNFMFVYSSVAALLYRTENTTNQDHRIIRFVLFCIKFFFFLFICSVFVMHTQIHTYIQTA